jgi:hypothetical protein
MFRITISKRQFLVAASAIVAIVPIVTFAALRITNSHSHPPDGASSGLEIELVTLRPAGCEPAEIVRPKDAFVLFIHHGKS